MEKPADQPNSVAVVNAVDVQSPDRKVVRRRFVQQTLFPLKPHEPKIENSAKKGKKKVEEIADDDEECCGSQGRSRKRGSNKKKEAKKVDVEIVDDHDDEEQCHGSQGRGKKRWRKPKQNSTPQKRGSKKVAVNGKDVSIIALGDIESPDDGSPRQLKDMQPASARNGRTHGNKGTPTKRIATHPAATHQTSQPVPDLWLEAKRIAEENSRLFAGKQVHPFFSAWKTGKKDQETIEGENNGCLNRRKERHAECGPIHVFENVQVDAEPIDWSNWTLCQGTFCNRTCDQERTTTSSETIVGSLNFGPGLNISEPSTTLLHLEDLSMGQYAHEDDCAIPTSDSPILVDDEVTPYDLLKNMERDFEIDKLGLMAGTIDNLSSTCEQQKAIILERIGSYYLSRPRHPENSLWTNKYQPEKASEVCGNSEAVKFINEWLHLWHSTDFRVTRRSSGAKCSLSEEDYDSYGSDSDLENVDDKDDLKNVLLVTGPVGSGKSAAIYACAKEQGFQVIEVNASDWRNGAILKQKFGEAVGSHWLKRSQENPVGSPSKSSMKSSVAVFTNNAAVLDLNKSVDEILSLSEEEDSADGMHRIPCDQSEIKTVILFEDVDATLCEDRGFISTIQQLADTGKRPMILTSNSENPVLPDSLAREEVFFTLPSLKDLTHHMYMVCAAEKANVQPSLIERCIRFCGGDIRKTLMHLQFWCQSKRFLKEGKVQMMYSPLMFTLEAGHRTLPKLIPWELPSSLSVFVEGEIANTLCNISFVENDSLLQVIEEEVGNTCVDNNNLDMRNDELASIEAKKEAILRENCFLHVDNDIIAVSNACDIYSSSDSPVAFAQRNVRRKLRTVLSDSEDDIPAVSGGLAGGDNNCSIPADEFFPIPCPAVNDTYNALDDELVNNRAIELELSAGTEHLNHFNFSPVGNSCGPTDHCVQYAEANFGVIQHQHIQLAGVNNNSKQAANYSLNLLGDQLLCPVEAKLEANRELFTAVSQAYQNSPPVGNPSNQSTDHIIQDTERDAMEAEMGNVDYGSQEPADYCVNPLGDLSQHCEESKMAVERCLFPQTLHVDPIGCTEDMQPDQSTNQFSGVLNMTDLPHQHLGEGIMNYTCQMAADCAMNSFTAQFRFHAEANVENIERKHPEIASANRFFFTSVDNSLNKSNEQFHAQGEKPPELQNQCVDPGTISHMNCTATVDDSLHQLGYQFPGIAKLEEIQLQDPGRADVRDTVCPPEDYSLKHMVHQLPFDEKKIESIQQQLPLTSAIDVISCSVEGTSVNPVNGKAFQFAEEQQSKYSEATNFDHVVNGCQSMDMSCVPESTFVPETEINDGTEFPSRDLTEIVSPLTIDTVGPSVPNCRSSGHVERCNDIDLNDKNEEMGDSQSENDHPEASTSGCQVMDECSRMDFCKTSRSFWSSFLAAKNPVQEKWSELRQKDLRQHFISESKNARQVLELSCGMSNLIAEADLLLYPSRFPTDDSLDQEICIVDETSNFGWRDQQIQMASAIAEHGYCLYARSIDSLRLMMGLDGRVHLAWELLASTSNSMALGKLLRLFGSNCQNFSAGERLKGAASTVEVSLIRERERCLQNMLTTIVPLRSHLALRGNALCDYLSSLAQISRSEASRLAEATEKRKGRRVRVAKKYLSSGGLDLSSDDISLLNEYNSYGKLPPIQNR